MRTHRSIVLGACAALALSTAAWAQMSTPPSGVPSSAPTPAASVIPPTTPPEKLGGTTTTTSTTTTTTTTARLSCKTKRAEGAACACKSDPGKPGKAAPDAEGVMRCAVP